MRMYEAEVLADSVSPSGARLTSIATVYPHAVHKDLLRHRMVSRVVESFRARPTELLIEQLRGGGAFRPEEFAARVAGMQQGEALADDEQVRANNLWDAHIEHCLTTAEAMGELNIAKQQRNFVLQDLCPLVEIQTSTEWENFRALRTEVDDEGRPLARPEVFRAAKSIMDALDASEPEEFYYGEYAVPLVTDEEIALWVADPDKGWDYIVKVSAGRCARVSYDKHRDPEPVEKSIERAERLTASGHMSPYEQCARPFSQDEEILRERLRDQIRQFNTDRGVIDELVIEQMIAQTRFQGNFRGWHQARKNIRGEHNYGLLRAAAAA